MARSKSKTVKKISKKKSVKKPAKARSSQKQKQKQPSKKVESAQRKPVGRKPSTRKAKRVQPTRKKSSYNLLSSQISEYCKQRQDGKPCSRQKISEIYNAIKSEQAKTPDKPLSQQQIQAIIEGKLAFVDVKSVPVLLRQFDWFRLVSVLVEGSGSFFKDQDLIVLNLTEIGLGSLRSPFFNLEDYYADEIYPTIQQYADELEDLTGSKFNSPPPQFVYDATQSDIDKRIFTWVFTMSEEIAEGISEAKEDIDYSDSYEEETPKETSKKEKEASAEVELEKAKALASEKREKELLAEAQLIKEYRELYSMGVLSKEELKSILLGLKRK